VVIPKVGSKQSKNQKVPESQEAVDVCFQRSELNNESELHLMMALTLEYKI